MSEQLDRRARDFSKFDSMTTEALQQILRLDAMKPEGEESDTEELLYVMEVLADRRRNDSTYTGKTTQQAFEDFQKYYMPEDAAKETASKTFEDKSNPSVRWLRWLGSLAAALAIVFLTTATANAFGFDLFGKVAKWSEEFFHFDIEAEPTVAPDPNSNSEIRYSSLQQVLDKYGITQKLVPTKMPEGYVLSELDISESPREVTVYARYSAEKGNIAISIRQILIGTPMDIEKNEAFVEVYEDNGIAYYLFLNMENAQVCWVNKECECVIAGCISLDEIKEMIDSIQ